MSTTPQGKKMGKKGRLDQGSDDALCDAKIARSPNYMSPTKSSSRYEPPTCKRIYLIRHGESMGQAAKKLGLNRYKDKKLLDAPLTALGIQQATLLSSSSDDESSCWHQNQEIELVIASPLTRALHTAVLGFPRQRILIHYDLAEMGSKVPENTPRPINKVLKDVTADDTTSKGLIDYKSLMPPIWPPPSYVHPSSSREGGIQRAMQYIFHKRTEGTIAIVCHYNIIRAILRDPSLRPANARPIACDLKSDGTVRMALDESSES